MFRKKDTKEIKNYVVIPSPEVLAFDKNPNDVDAVSLMSDTLTSHKSIGRTIQKNATVSPSITMTRPKAQTDVNFSDLNPSRGVSMTSSNTGLRTILNLDVDATQHQSYQENTNNHNSPYSHSKSKKSSNKDMQNPSTRDKLKKKFSGSTQAIFSGSPDGSHMNKPNMLSSSRTRDLRGIFGADHSKFESNQNKPADLGGRTVSACHTNQYLFQQPVVNNGQASHHSTSIANFKKLISIDMRKHNPIIPKITQTFSKFDLKNRDKHQDKVEKLLPGASSCMTEKGGLGLMTNGAPGDEVILDLNRTKSYDPTWSKSAFSHHKLDGSAWNIHQFEDPIKSAENMNKGQTSSSKVTTSKPPTGLSGNDVGRFHTLQVERSKAKTYGPIDTSECLPISSAASVQPNSINCDYPELKITLPEFVAKKTHKSLEKLKSDQNYLNSTIQKYIYDLEKSNSRYKKELSISKSTVKKCKRKLVIVAQRGERAGMEAFRRGELDAMLDEEERERRRIRDAYEI